MTEDQVTKLIDEAVQALERGETVAFPTETVYGLGADACNEQAVIDLYKLKGRPCDHPSIVHLHSLDQLNDWVKEVPPLALKLAQTCWPGPMTLILPKQPWVSPRITGFQDSVGIRLPSHPLARRLLQAFGRGVAAPSANRFGHISPTKAEHVRQEFGADVPIVIDGGPCQVGVESTIVDFTQPTPKILRPGMLTSTFISQVLGIPVNLGSGARAPGTLTKHYSPTRPSHLLNWTEISDIYANNRAQLAVVSCHAEPQEKCQGNCTWVKMPTDPKEYACELYSILRYLDAMHPEQILVETVPDSPQWEAVRDRITRACAQA